jgi:hypothetical protein
MRTTIKSPVTKISLELLSRRDNHLLAATAKLAILFAATLPSRLSRYRGAFFAQKVALKKAGRRFG